jgi:hypothetical protein
LLVSVRSGTSHSIRGEAKVWQSPDLREECCPCWYEALAADAKASIGFGTLVTFRILAASRVVRTNSGGVAAARSPCKPSNKLLQLAGRSF